MAWSDITTCAGNRIGADLSPVKEYGVDTLQTAYEACQFVLENESAILYLGALIGTVGVEAAAAIIGVAGEALELIVDLLAIIAVAMLLDALYNLLQCAYENS